MDDRTRWNSRYEDHSDPDEAPASLLSLDPYLPASGRCLEVAGGRGGGARWLSKRGLDVTLAEVSDVAIADAKRFAAEYNAPISTLLIDLEKEPFPAGPWDLITCFHYLMRPFFADAIAALSPGGVLAVGIATTPNLERNENPRAEFLLNPGEVLELTSGLDVVFHDEGWTDWGLHEARLVAVKPVN